MTDQQHHIGPGAINHLASAIISARKALLITGKASFEKCGAAGKVLPMLDDARINYTRFSDFSTNPDTIGLAKALDAARQVEPDTIIAVGGGSAIDMAKLTRHKLEGKRPLLIAVPTTAGTGSEATQFAVLYDNGIKTSVEAPGMMPDIAIVDPVFTYNTPPYLTACAGFDALAQAIEAYWNKNADDRSDHLALEAMELLYQALPRLIDNPADNSTRDQVARGAHLAGQAISITRTTAPHAFSYPFSVHYGYPHGHAVALTFPFIAEINLTRPGLPDNKKRKLINLLGLEGGICRTLSAYTHSLGLAPARADYDIPLLQSQINLARLANNPAEITAQDANTILIEATRPIV